MPTLETAFQLAATKLPNAGIDCLLIGGFAVNHYGYTRATLDVDFMIAADKIDPVRQVFHDAGFTNISLDDQVAFFECPDTHCRVDFLQVDSETLTTLLRNAQSTSYYGHRLRIPALRDLLAMKVFAWTNAPDRRETKDFPDIVYLAILNDLDPERDLHALFQQWGTERLYRKAVKKIQSLRAELQA